MKQVILDSNFNNIAVEWGIDKIFFKEYGYEILETKISENETLRNNVADGDREKYNELHQGSKKTAFFGFSDNPNASGFGSKFDDKKGGVFYSKNYDPILVRSEKNKNDRMLVTLAGIHGAIFISSDYKACNRAKNSSIEVIFIKLLNCKKHVEGCSVDSKEGLRLNLKSRVESNKGN